MRGQRAHAICLVFQGWIVVEARTLGYRRSRPTLPLLGNVPCLMRQVTFLARAKVNRVAASKSKRLHARGLRRVVVDIDTFHRRARQLLDTLPQSIRDAVGHAQHLDPLASTRGLLAIPAISCAWSRMRELPATSWARLLCWTGTPRAGSPLMADLRNLAFLTFHG